MKEYIFMFSLSLLFIIWAPIYYFRTIRKRGVRFYKSVEAIPVFCIFLFFFGYFIYLLQDITNVLTHRTIVYNGKCEVEQYSSSKSSGTTVFIGNKDISFDQFKEEVKEGSYFCRVEYYPKSKTGYSLKLYQSKNGKIVKEINN